MGGSDPDREGKKAAAPFRYARGEKEDSVRSSYSNLNIAVER